jgi:hypothetical protein
MGSLLKRPWKAPIASRSKSPLLARMGKIVSWHFSPVLG